MESIAIGQEIGIRTHLRVIGEKVVGFLKEVVWHAFSWTLAIVLTVVMGVGQFIGTIVIGGVVLFLQIGIVSVIIGFLIMLLAGRH